jgi:hypothetical protein
MSAWERRKQRPLKPWGVICAYLPEVVHDICQCRTSIPFFYEPNANAEVRSLVAAKDDGRRVVYANHLYSKVSTNFDHASEA